MLDDGSLDLGISIPNVISFHHGLPEHEDEALIGYAMLHMT